MPAVITIARNTLLFVALTSPLLAQQRDSTSGRDSTNTARRRATLAPVVVTGTLAAPAGSVGVSRSVLDHAALDAEPSRQAVDALRHVVGVHIDEANGPLGPTIIRLRGGEETFTRVLMDGVEVNENGGFFDAQGVTLTNVDRVEIARGPQSAVYGSSAMSGVVQMFTRGASPGPMRIDAGVEAGRNTSFGRSVRGNATVLGGNELARYSVGFGSSYDRGVYRLPNDVRANDASARVDLVPSRNAVITAVGRFMGVDGNLPVRDPGVHRAPLDPNQRQGRDRVLGTVQASLMANERWSNRLELSHYRRDFTFDDAFDNLDQSQFQSYVFDANYHYKSIVRRTNARYVGTVSTQPSGMTLSLAYGAEYERESLSDVQSGDFGPASQRVVRPSTSGFGEVQARIAQRLSILAGSRVEKFRGLAAAVVPRTALIVSAVPGRVDLRGGVSRAYKAPNIQEQFPNSPAIVANPDLKPETSNSWEIGTDLHSASGLATAALTFFHQDYLNLIRTVAYDATHQISRNIGRSRAAGLEVETAIYPRARWTLGAEGAWLGTRIIDNNGLGSADFPNGEPLPFRPAYTASAYIDAPILRTVNALVRVSGVGPQTVLANRYSGPRVALPSYRLIGATARWQVTRVTSAYVQLDNILNAGYQVAFDRPGLERAVSFGMQSSIVGRLR